MQACRRRAAAENRFRRHSLDGLVMSARATMSEIGRLAGAFGQRWFPERQIIVRQQETVRAIRLASHAQMLVACIFTLGGAWTLAATGAYLANVFQAKLEQKQLQTAGAQGDHATPNGNEPTVT